MSRRRAAESWRDPERRMQKAVKLRQQGLSLRQIADRLAVSYETIRRDLGRWESAEVDQLLSQVAVTYSPDDSSM